MLFTPSDFFSFSFQTFVAFSLLTCGAFADCWDENKCIFHQYNGSKITYSWDLRSLCNNGNGYQFSNQTNGEDYRFEICGSLTPKVPSASSCGGNFPCTVAGAQTYSYCNPEYNSWPFEGNFLQFFDPNPPSDCNLGACPNTGFLSPSLQNQQGYCCTGMCEIIAHGNAAYNYRWIDDNNVVTGGIGWTTYGETPDNGDEYKCPIDPFTGNPRARTLQVTILCNPNGRKSDPLQVISFYDNGSCLYTVIMRHFVACAITGNPFESDDDSNNIPIPQPSSNANSNTISVGTLNAYFFGYTVLGAALSVVLYYICAFGDDKGWWDPIKSALPEGMFRRDVVTENNDGYISAPSGGAVPFYISS
jgi:hypothetical protein